MKVLDHMLQLLADFATRTIGLWNLLDRESPVNRLDVEKTVSNEKIKDTLNWETPDWLKEAVREISTAERDSTGNTVETV